MRSLTLDAEYIIIVSAVASLPSLGGNKWNTLWTHKHRDVRSGLISSGSLLSDDIRKRTQILYFSPLSRNFLFQSRCFVSSDVNSTCHLVAFVCFELISCSLAVSRFNVSVFSSWGTQLFVQVNTASLSTIPAFPAFNFPPSTKREHTDGTVNLAASYCCILEFLPNTDQ